VFAYVGILVRKEMISQLLCYIIREMFGQKGTGLKGEGFQACSTKLLKSQTKNTV